MSTATHAPKRADPSAPGGAIILVSSMASQRANGRNPACESSKAPRLRSAPPLRGPARKRALAAM